LALKREEASPLRKPRENGGRNVVPELEKVGAWSGRDKLIINWLSEEYYP
jgi:hypothetical protein